MVRNGIRYNGKTSCKLGEINTKLREFLCKVGELNIDTSYRIFTENVVITFWRQDLSAMPDIVRVAKKTPLTGGIYSRGSEKTQQPGTSRYNICYTPV